MGRGLQITIGTIALLALGFVGVVATGLGGSTSVSVQEGVLVPQSQLESDSDFDRGEVVTWFSEGGIGLFGVNVIGPTRFVAVRFTVPQGCDARTLERGETIVAADVCFDLGFEGVIRKSVPDQESGQPQLSVELQVDERCYNAVSADGFAGLGSPWLPLREECTQ